MASFPLASSCPAPSCRQRTPHRGVPRCTAQRNAAAPPPIPITTRARTPQKQGVEITCCAAFMATEQTTRYRACRQGRAGGYNTTAGAGSRSPPLARWPITSTQPQGFNRELDEERSAEWAERQLRGTVGRLSVTGARVRAGAMELVGWAVAVLSRRLPCVPEEMVHQISLT